MTRVAAVAGLRVEAGIARRAGIEAGASGAVPAVAAALAERFVAQGAQGLVSFGVAGGASPTLRCGSTILADAVTIDGARLPCDPRWLERAAARLPGAKIGPIVASNTVVATREAKAALASGGALAVDMESGAVARVARAYGVPFLVVRAIADHAEDEIPAAAAAALLPGAAGVRAFLGALAREPGAAVGLARLGWRTAVALNALRRSVRTLGPDLALP